MSFCVEISIGIDGQAVMVYLVYEVGIVLCTE